MQIVGVGEEVIVKIEEMPDEGIAGRHGQVDRGGTRITLYHCGSLVENTPLDRVEG